MTIVPYQNKRSSVTGHTPTTSDISAGQFAINLVDYRLFTSNGTATFDAVQNVSSNFMVGGNLISNGIIITTAISANGTIGSNGQYLSSNGTVSFWANTTAPSYAMGTLTSSNSFIVSQTWNNASVNFLGTIFNVTNTAAGVNSFISDWQAAGSSVARIDIAGRFICYGGVYTSNYFQGYNYGNKISIDSGSGKFAFLGGGASIPFFSLGTANSSNPALKPIGSQLAVRLGDDSGYANLAANTITFGDGTTQSTATTTTSGLITVTTTGTTTQVIDSFLLTVNRTAEYLISVKDNAANNYDSSIVKIMHDGTNGYLTEYGYMSTNTSIGNYTVSTNSTALILNYTPTSVNTTIKLIRTTLIPV